MNKKIININTMPAFYENLSTRTAEGLVAYLNTISESEALSHLSQYKNTVHIQEILPYEVFFVDSELNVVIKEPGSNKFFYENMDVLWTYIKLQNSLTAYCSNISDFPEFVNGVFVFFRCTHKNRQALIARISIKSKYYVVLLPTKTADKMPTDTDSRYIWEIYHDDETSEFFFFDDGEYDFEECANRILMAEMVGMYDLDNNSD